MAEKRDEKRDAKAEAKEAPAPLAAVGTIVFYTPGKDEPTATENAAGVPAMVVANQESGSMTLVVFDSDGKVLVRKGVSAPVLGEDGKPPGIGPYAMTELKDITPPEPVAPVLASLDPAHGQIGGPDVEMSCVGTGFTTTSVIMFAGNPEPIRYYGPESISTMIRMSLGWGEGPVPVTVKNGELETAPLEFTFDPAEVVEQPPAQRIPPEEAPARAGKKAGDPDELEDRLDEAVDEGDATVRHRPTHKPTRR